MKKVLVVAVTFCTALGGAALAANTQKLSFNVDGAV
jgi:hypothetical protein